LNGNKKNKAKAVFFDRDGVINFRLAKAYVKKPEELIFLIDFLSIFPELKQSGFKTFMVTNQQGVGKGLMTEDQLRKVFDFIQRKLSEEYSFQFDDIYYCCDLEEEDSFYRKPNPGMLLKGIKKWNIDVFSSWMIGDSPKDAIAGKRAALKTILVGNRKETACPEADFFAKNLYEAKDIILSTNSE